MTPEPIGIKNKGLVEIECIGRESVSSVRLWHALEAVAGAIESRYTGPNATDVCSVTQGTRRVDLGREVTAPASSRT